MKKILLILLSLVLFAGCYTTLYPPANIDMSAANEIPDSTRQVIINNYYETTEYYQVPYYHRYSLLWDGYYWDPFYYDYSYYHWRPYYWYGHYYYYNPHNHYWYYYDNYYPWHSGSWSGGSSNNGNKERIHKPGYNVLTTTSGSSLPFVSSTTDNSNGGRIGKPSKKVGVDLNSGISNDNNYYRSSSPKIESVGKKPVGSTNTPSATGKATSGYKSESKKSSTTISKPQKQISRPSSNSSSSSSKSSKQSNTSSTSSKNNKNESSSSSSKKSK